MILSYKEVSIPRYMLTSLLVKERAVSKSDDLLNNQDKKHLVNWSNLHQKKDSQ